MSPKADHHDSFFVSLRPLFLLGQVCGVLPLLGTTGSCSDLKFSWMHWQMLYVGTILVTTLFFNVISTIENVSDGIQLDNFGSTVFYTVCILNIVFFVDLSRQLPDICRKVHKTEVSLAEYGYPKGINYLIKKFLAIFLILSIFEHSLLTYLNVIGSIADSEAVDMPFLECFFARRFPETMQYISYNPGIAIFVFLVHVICTFNWNYLDFFLTSISIQLSGKFLQINAALAKSANKFDLIPFWKKLWKDYNDLSTLTKDMDSKISKLVFMSYVSNLYHLSLQLLRSLKFQGDRYSRTYFYFSMAYLILRILTVSLCAAKIKDESQASKHILFSIRNPCEPACRLLHQVITDDIHITGKQFFTVDRKFIVAMIGTFVTYEIILLQLNSAL